jgi:AraC-like DNA-binding protein
MASPLELPADFFAQLAFRRLRVDGEDRFLGGGAKASASGGSGYNGALERNLCINLVLRGRGEYIDQGQRRHPLLPGTLFHRIPGRSHRTAIDADSGYAECFLYCDAITGLGLVASGLILPTPVLPVGVDALVIDSYLQLLGRLREPEERVPSRRALLETAAFVTELYDRAHRQRVLGRWERIIEEACLRLEHDLAARYPIERLAARLGVSYRAFRKHFKAATGHAPMDYRIRRRLEAAQLALMSKSATETARDLGYEDLYSFSAQFRSFVGMSPRRFQVQMQDRLSFVPLARPWQAPERPAGGS